MLIKKWIIIYMAIGIFISIAATILLDHDFFIRIFFFISLSFTWISIFFKWRKRKGELLNPHTIYKPILIVTIIIQLFYIDGEISNEGLIIILMLPIIFIVTLEITSSLIKTNKIKTNNKQQTHIAYKNEVFIFILLFIIGWAWRIYALKSGLMYGTFLATKLEITSYSNLLGQLNGLAFIGLIGFFIFKHEKQKNTVFYIGLLLEILWILLSGSKAAILYAMMPIILILYRRGMIRVNLKTIISALIIIIFFFISFSAIQIYRTVAYVQFSENKKFNMEEIISEFKYKVTEKNSDNNEIISRLNWAGYFLALYEKPHLWSEWRLGDTLIPSISWWIPRALWPEKSIVSVGGWYGEHVLGWNYTSRSEGAITIWGDGLINFGYIGIILFPLIWIIIIVYFFNMTYYGGNWRLLILSLTYMRLLIGLEQNLSVTFVSIQQTILLILIIRFFTKIRVKL